MHWWDVFIYLNCIKLKSTLRIKFECVEAPSWSSMKGFGMASVWKPLLQRGRQWLRKISTSFTKTVFLDPRISNWLLFLVYPYRIIIQQISVNATTKMSGLCRIFLNFLNGCAVVIYNICWLSKLIPSHWVCKLAEYRCIGYSKQFSVRGHSCMPRFPCSVYIVEPVFLNNWDDRYRHISFNASLSALQVWRTFYSY